MSATDAEDRWTALAHGPCPAPDELLLVAAEVLGDPAHAGTRDALDDQARMLFGTTTRIACATRLSIVMELELGYRPDPRDRPELLSLTRVVQTRVGHPLLLAIVAVALLRRAGHPGTVCHADGRWLGAACGSPFVVLDNSPGERPDNVRPVCGHLVGHTVLNALRHSLEGRRFSRAADLDGLLEDLPISTPSD